MAVIYTRGATEERSDSNFLFTLAVLYEEYLLSY